MFYLTLIFWFACGLGVGPFFIYLRLICPFIWLCAFALWFNNNRIRAQNFTFLFPLSHRMWGSRYVATNGKTEKAGESKKINLKYPPSDVACASVKHLCMIAYEWRVTARTHNPSAWNTHWHFCVALTSSCRSKTIAGIDTVAKSQSKNRSKGTNSVCSRTRVLGVTQPFHPASQRASKNRVRQFITIFLLGWSQSWNGLLLIFFFLFIHRRTLHIPPSFKYRRHTCVRYCQLMMLAIYFVWLWVCSHSLSSLLPSNYSCQSCQ